MLTLDIPSLLFVTLFIYFLMAALILVAAIQGRFYPVLWWLSGALAIGSIGVTLGVLNTRGQAGLFAFWLASALPITSHACIWNGIRRFVGKSASVPVLLAGAVVWAILCLSPAFVASSAAQVLVLSALALVYTVATIAALWPESRRHPAAAGPVLLFLAVHAAFNIYRMVPRHSAGASWADSSDLALTLLESVLFTIGLAFTILAMVRTRTERRYQHASLHDALTGLPNRRALFEKAEPLLASADEEGSEIAVLMCDLDGFKQVNDRFGHAVGDQILVKFSSVLRDTAGAENFCARLGGEEFVVLVPPPHAAEAVELANRIRAALALRSPELPCPQTVSIGVAHRREHGMRLDRLLSRADQALYFAKTSGRDRVESWPVEVPEGSSWATATRRRYVQPNAQQASGTAAGSAPVGNAAPT